MSVSTEVRTAERVVTYGGLLPRNGTHPAGKIARTAGSPHSWTAHSEAHSQFVVRSECSGFVASSDTAVWIKGYVSVCGQPRDCRAEEYVLEHYRQYSTIPYDALEGSFLIAIHDVSREKILIYRNIAGAVDLFYSLDEGEFLYSTNLALLTKGKGRRIRLREDLLPVFFLYRCVPGSETLFEGISRLLPGDLLVFKSDSINRQKVRTFGEFRGSIAVREDIVAQIDETIGAAIHDCIRTASPSAILLSGGVDSTLLQSHWNQCVGNDQPHISYCATLDHPQTVGELAYARSAADYLNTTLIQVPLNRPYLNYLDGVIHDTAETPNHVQAAYFPVLAEAMRADGFTTGISGEAGDGLFGIATQHNVQIAELLRKCLPFHSLRNWLKALCFGARGSRWAQHLELSNRLDDLNYLLHPINQQASFAHLESVLKCFGRKAVSNAMDYRRALIATNGLDGSYVEQLHAANLLTSSINSASYWNTLFETQGAQLLSPFLDSRVIRLAMCVDDKTKYQFRKPKQLLKEALARRTTHELSFREKLSFGQPIFEWMAAGGQLRSAVEQIDRYEFVDSGALTDAKAEPNWFLYNLLCFDRLNKLVLAN